VHMLGSRDYTEEDLVYLYSLSFSHDIGTTLVEKRITNIHEEKVYIYIKKILSCVSTRLLIEIFDATLKLLEEKYNLNILQN